MNIYHPNIPSKFRIELMPFEYTIWIAHKWNSSPLYNWIHMIWIGPGRWNSSTARDVFIIGPGRREGDIHHRLPSIRGCHPHESHEKRDILVVFGGFSKWWYQTTIGFPTKNDHFGVFWGYHHLRKHPHRGMKNQPSCVGMFWNFNQWNFRIPDPEKQPGWLMVQVYPLQGPCLTVNSHRAGILRWFVLA